MHLYGIKKQLYCWCILSAIICSLATCGASGIASVHIELKNRNVLLCEPIEVKVAIKNDSRSNIEMYPLSPIGEDANVKFFVISEKGENLISKPIFILEQYLHIGSQTIVKISSGKTSSENFLIGMEWTTERPIFSMGANKIYCTINTRSHGVLKSQLVSIIVHAPTTDEETDISRILTDVDTIRSLYDVHYLTLAKYPVNVVKNVHRIMQYNVPLSVRAKDCIDIWRTYEQRTREGRAPGFKAKGFDKLGLHEDLDQDKNISH